MSEVQKFREYRKILKAKIGAKPLAPAEETIGDWVREKNRSLFGSGMRWYNRNSPAGRQAVAIEKETIVKDANGKEWILKPNGTKVSVAARQANTRATTDNTQSDTDSSSLVAFSPIRPEFRDEYKNKKETVQQSTTTTKTGRTGRTGRISKPTVKVTPKGQAYWDSQYQDFLKNKMTADQKAWLDQRGIDYSSAEKMQDYLQRIGKKNIGKFGVDNKWGGDSQTAWEDFVNTTMKNNPLQTPVEEPVVDAPDPFGYKTSNTYEDDDFASKLKRMGIRSNADLMHFMYESGKEGWQGDEWTTQFRNDVDRLLGGDYSDKNIRKVFKTKNGWNNGFMGRGDFGDFQNVLQTNVGVWNGMHDAKEQASRTGASGTVYSSPKMMRKFESIKLQPNQNNQGLTSSTKFDFSNMKFNNIFTNTGATTLGNIPSTTSINLSQEFTKDLTPNIPSMVYKPGTSDWLDWAQ